MAFKSKSLPTEVLEKIESHQKWLQGLPEGKQANWFGCKLEGLDMRGVNLPKAIFTNAGLINCNFQGSNLSEADFGAADLDNTNLSNTNLSKAILENTNRNLEPKAPNTNLENSNLTNAIMANSFWDGSNFKNTNLTGAITKRADFKKADLTDAILPEDMVKKHIATTVTPINKSIESEISKAQILYKNGKSNIDVAKELLANYDKKVVTDLIVKYGKNVPSRSNEACKFAKDIVKAAEKEIKIQKQTVQKSKGMEI